jgi:hypothetical protein
MPKSITCLLHDQIVTIEDALDIRGSKEKIERQKLLNMLCVECKQPVRPHKAGAHGAAHFEHYRRNPACKLSDKLKDRKGR